jgi:hypothetical protein
VTLSIWTIAWLTCSIPEACSWLAMVISPMIVEGWRSRNQW